MTDILPGIWVTKDGSAFMEPPALELETTSTFLGKCTQVIFEAEPDHVPLLCVRHEHGPWIPVTAGVDIHLSNPGFLVFSVWRGLAWSVPDLEVQGAPGSPGASGYDRDPDLIFTATSLGVGRHVLLINGMSVPVVVEADAGAPSVPPRGPVNTVIQCDEHPEKDRTVVMRSPSLVMCPTAPGGSLVLFIEETLFGPRAPFAPPPGFTYLQTVSDDSRTLGMNALRTLGATMVPSVVIMPALPPWAAQALVHLPMTDLVARLDDGSGPPVAVPASKVSTATTYADVLSDVRGDSYATEGPVFLGPAHDAGLLVLPPIFSCTLQHLSLANVPSNACLGTLLGAVRHRLRTLTLDTDTEPSKAMRLPLLPSLEALTLGSKCASRVDLSTLRPSVAVAMFIRPEHWAAAIAAVSASPVKTFDLVIHGPYGHISQGDLDLWRSQRKSVTLTLSGGWRTTTISVPDRTTFTGPDFANTEYLKRVCTTRGVGDPALLGFIVSLAAVVTSKPDNSLVLCLE